jgi:predicted dehydrogenase
MDDPLAVQMSHFADVIAGREAPLVSGWEGLKSLKVVEAVAMSSASGREISLVEGAASGTANFAPAV